MREMMGPPRRGPAYKTKLRFTVSYHGPKKGTIEGRHRKKHDAGKTDSSESLNTSDNEDRKKDARSNNADDKHDSEAQLQHIQLDMEALREEKSTLEMMLNGKINEASKLSSRIADLESQLSDEKDACQRSQARFERFADLLASDTLKPCSKDQGSSAAKEDPYNAYEMSPSDQRQNHETARKRSIALSTSEEGRSGKKRRECYDNMIPMSEKYRPEDALEPFQSSKGTETKELLSAKKNLGEGDNNEEGNIVSSGNVFTDRYEGGDDEVLVD
ncbi:hypothetical protein E2562_036027 [Oryza meyeriana var. granulata]|uniref:Uncharacterized protein n=1 Tax=Oryza meyeriana var. granulata TaxID=110450 RepID=A0A6G1CX17_9ORYZ|nr:hypothetical protein E2562_036027 [Oryza meyeriana var. granulata]